VGTIAFTPLLFNGSDQLAKTKFTAVGAGTTTVTAAVPAGFSTPAASANSLTATVRPASILAPNITVGKYLQTALNIQLQGTSQVPLIVTITSNSPDLLVFSTSRAVAGSKQAIQVIPAGFIGTAFWAQALAGSGSATYTVTISSATFGTATGTVTFAPSGVFVENQTSLSGFANATTGPGGIGLVSLKTAPTFAHSLGIGVAMLDATGNIADAGQYLIPSKSLSVNVTSSNTGVATINPTTVTIPGGVLGAYTQLQATALGNTSVTISTPAGFTTPSQYTSVPVTVATNPFQ